MPKVSRTCLGCGAVFLVFPHRVKDGNGKYCSKQCAGSAGGKISATLHVAPKGTDAEKVRARHRIGNKIKTGQIIRPEKCEECGRNGIIEAHHDDYSKPDEVRWLCGSCHAKIHRKRAQSEF